MGLKSRLNPATVNGPLFLVACFYDLILFYSLWSDFADLILGQGYEDIYSFSN